jgi:hypothetical protein
MKQASQTYRHPNSTSCLLRTPADQHDYSATKPTPYVETVKRANASVSATIPSSNSNLVPLRFSRPPTLRLRRTHQPPQYLPPPLHPQLLSQTVLYPKATPQLRQQVTRLLHRPQAGTTLKATLTPLILRLLPPLPRACTLANRSTTACQWILL